MPTVNLPKGVGKGTYKASFGTASIASGGTITATNLDTIVAVELSVEASSGNYAIGSVTSISGNVVTVGLAGAANGTAPANLTASQTVHYVIYGY